MDIARPALGGAQQNQAYEFDDGRSFCIQIQLGGGFVLGLFHLRRLDGNQFKEFIVNIDLLPIDSLEWPS